MENVVEALYMAAAILILIVALTVSISSFTTLKGHIETIISSDDVVDLATEDENDPHSYINYITETVDDVREVGAETVISSIRRVPRESYTVYIGGLNSLTSSTNSNDFEYVNGYLKISTDNTNYKNLTNKNMKQIYEEIKAQEDAGYIFKEYIGVYQEDLQGVSEANRATYRVITYERVPT